MEVRMQKEEDLLVAESGANITCQGGREKDRMTRARNLAVDEFSVLGFVGEDMGDSWMVEIFYGPWEITESSGRSRPLRGLPSRRTCLTP